MERGAIRDAPLEHDAEKWVPVFGKHHAPQEAKARWRFEEKPSRFGARKQSRAGGRLVLLLDCFAGARNDESSHPPRAMCLRRMRRTTHQIASTVTGT
ncbi:MAG TPA: hypothetical protein VEK73_08155, partial [Xanthobacteraceae bacterium]|nr:hypothetical protein [Xanthobacteraceae bacterium]